MDTPDTDDAVNHPTSSMLDVAAAAGVSVSTVSRALRASPNVRPDTIARVRAAADALGFAVSPSAAGLATGKVKRIAVLIGSPLTDWFSGAILDGIYRVLRPAGFDLLLYRVHDPDERRTFFETLPARRNADAMIVASFALTPDEQRTVERMRMPVVYLNQHVPGRPSVGIDDVEAGRQAVRYLAGLGHRDLRYVRASLEPGFTWSASDRLRGFLEEQAAQGLPARPEDLLEDDVDDDFGARIAARLVSGPLPVAVVAEHDGLATRILLGLWQQGVRVPEDVSVIGVDGQEPSARFGLTTIVQPVDRLAEAAAELAVRLARGTTSPDDTTRVTFPTALRVGRSTRAPEPR